MEHFHPLPHLEQVRVRLKSDSPDPRNWHPHHRSRVPPLWMCVQIWRPSWEQYSFPLPHSDDRNQIIDDIHRM